MYYAAVFFLARRRFALVVWTVYVAESVRRGTRPRARCGLSGSGWRCSISSDRKRCWIGLPCCSCFGLSPDSRPAAGRVGRGRVGGGGRGNRLQARVHADVAGNWALNLAREENSAGCIRLSHGADQSGARTALDQSDRTAGDAGLRHHGAGRPAAAVRVSRCMGSSKSASSPAGGRRSRATRRRAHVGRAPLRRRVWARLSMSAAGRCSGGWRRSRRRSVSRGRIGC